jgi:hypothetical protein
MNRVDMKNLLEKVAGKDPDGESLAKKPAAKCAERVDCV